jgi:hypothetical protein
MKIEPGKSVGQLAIGMNCEQYELLLGSPEYVFRRTPVGSPLVVAYDKKFIHLTVDEKRAIISISVFRPAQIELGGIQLLGRELVAVKEDLAGSAFCFLPVDAGLECEVAGIVVGEYDGFVDSVEVGPATVNDRL